MKLSIGETYTVTLVTILTIGMNMNKGFGAVEHGTMRSIGGGSAGGGKLEA
jgi:hypothetical protein